MTSTSYNTCGLLAYQVPGCLELPKCLLHVNGLETASLELDCDVHGTQYIQTATAARGTLSPPYLNWPLTGLLIDMWKGWFGRF